jgi:hypothetical protein
MSQLTPSQQLHFQILGDLHKNWTPHPGQVTALKPLIDGKIKTLFLQCARKWGKTECAVYLLWRQCLLYPGSACYYVAPTIVHARKIVWIDPRLSTFGDKKYVEDINQTEMIVKFKNGSFIQILGSENHYAANGLRPSFLVLDELAEHDFNFLNIMQPNRIVYDAPMLVIGTPPIATSKNREQYLMLADECKISPDSMWIKQTSYENTHIPKERLDKIKAKMLARGEGYLWEAYYLAEIVAGGPNSVFPMLDKDVHILPSEEIRVRVMARWRLNDWYCTVTPGANTTAAALFLTIDKSTKSIYVLDEVYERQRERTRAALITQSLVKKAGELCLFIDFDEDWNKVCSETGTWFSSEVADREGYFFSMAPKLKGTAGISIIKDLLHDHSLYISDKCVNLFREMRDYVTRPDGTPVKGNDYLIEALRNTLAAANYSVKTSQDPTTTLGPRTVNMLEDESWEDSSTPWSE